MHFSEKIHVLNKNNIMCSNKKIIVSRISDINRFDYVCVSVAMNSIKVSY